MLLDDPLFQHEATCHLFLFILLVVAQQLQFMLDFWILLTTLEADEASKQGRDYLFTKIVLNAFTLLYVLVQPFLFMVLMRLSCTMAVNIWRGNPLEDDGVLHSVFHPIVSAISASIGPKNRNI